MSLSLAPTSEPIALTLTLAGGSLPVAVSLHEVDAEDSPLAQVTVSIQGSNSSPALVPIVIELSPVDATSVNAFVKINDPSSPLSVEFQSLIVGPTGLTGATPQISATAEAIGAGLAPTVTVSGPDTAPALLFGIPAAQTGPGFGAVRYNSGVLNQTINGFLYQLAFASASTTGTLLAPFNGYSFWDGNAIDPRAANDVYIIKVTLTVTPLLSGGYLQVGLGPPSAAFTNSENNAMLGDSGDPQTLTYVFPVNVSAGLVSSGIVITLNSSVTATLTGASITVYPIGYGTT